MQLVYLTELFDLVVSGRLQAFGLRRHDANPRLIQIRVRAHNCSDELWVDISAMESSENLPTLIEEMLNTLIDQVSPG